MGDKNLQKQFEDIYNSESDPLFRYCLMRVGRREQALDIVQEVFMEFWREYCAGKDIKNSRAFLFKVLRNKIIDWYRRKKALSLDTLLEQNPRDNLEPSENALEENAMYTEETARAVEGINALPEKYRDVVYLRLVEDLSPKEIAARLQSNTNIVSIRLNRGLKKLREYLNQELI